MRWHHVLRNPRFAWFTATNGLGFVAAWMYRLALGWTVWELTRSGYWLGLLALCDLGPALIFGPLGGVWGDRAGAAKVIAWAQGLVILTMALVAFAVWSGAPPHALLALSLLGGSAVTVEDAARASIVSVLVADEQRGPAVALTAVVINLARFLGPVLAGIIAAFADVLWVFGLAILLGLPLAVFAVLVRLPHAAPGRRARWHAELGEGWRYVRSEPVIGLVLLNFLLSSLLARPAYELVPGLAGAVFEQDIVGLSAMTTAIGLGAIGAGLVMLRSRQVRGAVRATFAGACASGVVVAALAAMPHFQGALILCVLMGFSVSLGAIAAQIVVQLSGEPELRNRVLAIWSLIIRVGPAAGALVIGAMADRLGFRWPLGAAGAAAALAAAAIWFTLRRRLGKPA